MLTILEKIRDHRLKTIVDIIKTGDDTEKFESIKKNFSEYDPSFLLLLSCFREGISRKYIEENYKKFHKILDQNFPIELAKSGGFESRMWEMILCDVLSASGELMSKGEKGADFLLKGFDGQLVQIEAVAPNESFDKELRSKRPEYTTDNFSELSGNIEDLECPVLLRVFDKGFIEKAVRKKYDNDKPLIIAINSSKTVGLTSFDEYILRRVFCGLGFNTIRINSDGTHSPGLQQNPFLNKPSEKSFEVAVFRNPKYKHISGIIYTSQPSLGFIPGGYSWSNSGITFVSNSVANYQINLQFPFFKKMLCDEEKYQEIKAEQEFKSVIEFS